MANEDQGFGGMAKKWLKSKADELLSSDDTARARDQRGEEQEQAERGVQDEVGRTVLHAAFPG